MTKKHISPDGNLWDFFSVNVVIDDSSDDDDDSPDVPQLVYTRSGRASIRNRKYIQT